MQLSVPIQHGHSGGPVLDQAGNVPSTSHPRRIRAQLSRGELDLLHRFRRLGQPGEHRDREPWGGGDGARAVLATSGAGGTLREAFNADE